MLHRVFINWRLTTGRCVSKELRSQQLATSFKVIFVVPTIICQKDNFLKVFLIKTFTSCGIYRFVIRARMTVLCHIKIPSLPVWNNFMQHSRSQKKENWS